MDSNISTTDTSAPLKNRIATTIRDAFTKMTSSVLNLFQPNTTNTPTANASISQGLEKFFAPVEEVARGGYAATSQTSTKPEDHPATDRSSINLEKELPCPPRTSSLQNGASEPSANNSLSQDLEKLFAPVKKAALRFYAPTSQTPKPEDHPATDRSSMNLEKELPYPLRTSSLPRPNEYSPLKLQSATELIAYAQLAASQAALRQTPGVGEKPSVPPRTSSLQPLRRSSSSGSRRG